MDLNRTGEWEYMTVTSGDPGVINEYASQGWELVSATQAPANFEQPQKPKAANRLASRAGLLLLAALVLVILLSILFTLVGQQANNNRIPLSQVAADIQAGKVMKIIIHEDSDEIAVLESPPQSGPVFTAVKEPNGDLSRQLTDLGVPPDRLGRVEISVEKASSWGQYANLLGLCAPGLILVGGFVLLAWILARVRWNSTILFIFRRPRPPAQDVPR